MSLLNLNPTDMLKSIGVIGLMVIIFAESGLFVGFFFPGDTLLFTAGFLASTHVLSINIYLMASLTFIAAAAGDSVGYTFGRKFGPKLFAREDSIFLHKENVERATKFYEKHGGKTVLLARFIPAIRTFAPIVAGIGKMRYKRFIAFNVIGSALWVSAMVYLGDLLGSKVKNIDKYTLPIVIFILLASFAPAIIHLSIDKKSRRLFLEKIRVKKRNA
jgi:membrane-associated protein